MKLIYIIAIALVIILMAVSGQQGCEPEPLKKCELSLCDCKCHFAGFTPEELEDKVCGINCYNLYNISGCKYENNSCNVVYRNTTKECELSLCDCKCHFAGFTPEELQGVLCGINCHDLYNVSGCKYENSSCKVIYHN